MGLRKPSNARFFTRYVEVASNFPGHLALESGGKPLDGRVLDVCRDGLGVLLAEAVEAGAEIFLEMRDRSILFNVEYCEPDLVHKGYYRCGLTRRGAGENLVSLFQANAALAGPRAV